MRPSRNAVHLGTFAASLMTYIRVLVVVIVIVIVIDAHALGPRTITNDEYDYEHEYEHDYDYEHEHEHDGGRPDFVGAARCERVANDDDEWDREGSLREPYWA